jgi:hypothetical protein
MKFPTEWRSIPNMCSIGSSDYWAHIAGHFLSGTFLHGPSSIASHLHCSAAEAGTSLVIKSACSHNDNTTATHQYSKTNVMHFSFNLLRIKSFTCFKHYLLILKRHCTSTRTQYTKCRLCNTSWGWASNAWNKQRPSFSINWKTSVSHWFYYTDLLQCMVNKT